MHLRDLNDLDGFEGQTDVVDELRVRDERTEHV